MYSSFLFIWSTHDLSILALFNVLLSLLFLFRRQKSVFFSSLLITHWSMCDLLDRRSWGSFFSATTERGVHREALSSLLFLSSLSSSCRRLYTGQSELQNLRSTVFFSFLCFYSSPSLLCGRQYTDRSEMQKLRSTVSGVIPGCSYILSFTSDAWQITEELLCLWSDPMSQVKTKAMTILCICKH